MAAVARSVGCGGAASRGTFTSPPPHARAPSRAGRGRASSRQKATASRSASQRGQDAARPLPQPRRRRLRDQNAGHMHRPRLAIARRVRTEGSIEMGTGGSVNRFRQTRACSSALRRATRPSGPTVSFAALNGTSHTTIASRTWPSHRFRLPHRDARMRSRSTRRSAAAASTNAAGVQVSHGVRSA